ncbi:MAG: orotidine 5'-phosphate decarboxylase [Thelocarpon impressellum]|nr:MAG: orotidine 5'-phosphate decarboxylase [Thelocarpon impressellum]
MDHHATLLRQSFAARAVLPGTHPLARFLLHLMTTKRTNLCLSADVSSTAQLLELAEDVGDSICMLKTHADIIDDFGQKTIDGLREVAARKRFLVFEDRKLGDIGSTVQRQYTSGPCRIVEWASIVNAHVFPGPAIVSALRAAAESFLKSSTHTVTTEITAAAEPDDGSEPVGRTDRQGSIVSTTTIETRVETSHPRAESSDVEGVAAALDDLGQPPLDRGLLLLAEMSSEGNLMGGEYTARCVEMAREHRDFCLGFISQKSLNGQPEDNFITFTPGVSLPPKGAENGVRQTNGDGLGQQYNTPRAAVLQNGADVVIVGRGIYKARNRVTEAERYRKEAWRAYEERVR